MPEPMLGFIGGSGLYDMEGLANRREIEIDTPFGEPSDSIITGELEGSRRRIPAAPWTRPPNLTQ